MIKRYSNPADTWATVTPVILPGYDDPRKLAARGFSQDPISNQTLDQARQKEVLTKLDRRIDYLLRKAIGQAGYSRACPKR